MLRRLYGDEVNNLHTFTQYYDVELTTSGKYVFQWDETILKNAVQPPDLNTATGVKRMYYIMNYGGVYVLNDGTYFPLGYKPTIIYKRPKVSASPTYGCFALPEQLTVTWKPSSVLERNWTLPTCKQGFTFNKSTNLCESKPICDAKRDITQPNGDCIYNPLYNK
jgi:hypothetical protein